MSRRETIRVIRDIVSGRSSYDSARITVVRRGCNVYTGHGISYFDHRKDEFVVRHDRNGCTMKQAKVILENYERMIG